MGAKKRAEKAEDERQTTTCNKYVTLIAIIRNGCLYAFLLAYFISFEPFRCRHISRARAVTQHTHMKAQLIHYQICKATALRLEPHTHTLIHTTTNNSGDDEDDRDAGVTLLPALLFMCPVPCYAQQFNDVLITFLNRNYNELQ